MIWKGFDDCNPWEKPEITRIEALSTLSKALILRQLHYREKGIRVGLFKHINWTLAKIREIEKLKHLNQSLIQDIKAKFKEVMA
jgi:hypothetical protein